MTVNEFIRYLIEEVATGNIDGKSTLCTEWQESPHEVDGVSQISEKYVLVQGGDSI